MFLVLTSHFSQGIFSQRPTLEVDCGVCCVTPCTAHDSAVVQVSYLSRTCQKPQMFLSQQHQKHLGVSTQLKTTMSAVDFLANWFHFIAKRWEQEKKARDEGRKASIWISRAWKARDHKKKQVTHYCALQSVEREQKYSWKQGHETIKYFRKISGCEIN